MNGKFVIDPFIFCPFMFILFGIIIYNELKILVVKRMYRKSAMDDADIINAIVTYNGYRLHFIIAFCFLVIGFAVVSYLFPSDLPLSTILVACWPLILFSISGSFLVSGYAWRTLDRHISIIFYRLSLGFGIVIIILLVISLIINYFQ
ncbi:putative membrane protein [Parabacteroides sp. PF5-9]|nr:putative membrane protein [Parabacteroides sp. PF5-9]